MNVKVSGFMLFLLLSNLLLFVVSIPMILTWAHTLPGTVNTWVHGTPIDYYQYLAAIKEGMNGSWRTSDVYTTESTPKSLVFVFFLVIGKIGGVFQLSTVAIYHIARIIAIECMFVTIYSLCKEVLGKTYAFWAATIGLFSTALPLIYVPALGPFMGDISWWDVLDPLHRADYLPHHAFGTALLFTSVLFLLRFVRLRRIPYFFIAILSSFFAGIIYPTSGLLLVIAPILTAIVYLTKTNRATIRSEFHRIFPICLISLGALTSLLIMKVEISKGFPWDGYTNGGYGVWGRVSNFERNFVLGAGLTFVLSIPAIIRALIRRNSFTEIFVSVWALTPMVLIMVAAPLGLEKIRMAYLGQFGAYGILATLSLIWLSQKLRSRLKPRIAFIFLGVILSANVLFVSGYYLRNRLLHQVYTGEYFHLRQGLLTAYSFIDLNVPKYSNVVGDFTVGSTLPGFATVKTYFGHWTQTIDYWNKEALTRDLFSGKYSPEEAVRLFSNGHIQYILVYQKEQREAIDSLSLHISLKTIYRDGDVRIYKVGERIL